MDYLNSFVSVIYKYLDDIEVNLEGSYMIVDIIKKRIFVSLMYGFNAESLIIVSILKTYLNNFDDSIIIDNIKVRRGYISIIYKSSKILTQDELLRIGLFNYIIDTFIDEVYRIWDIDGNLTRYYPFHSSSNIQRNFYDYQREIITNLPKAQIMFYNKLRSNIEFNAVSHIYNEVHQMKTSGFLFYQHEVHHATKGRYEDNTKVKILIFNER